jgi:hypothetical protein
LIWREWECFWFGPTLALVVVDPGTFELAEPPQEDATSAAVTTSRIVAVRALPIASTLPLGTNLRAGRNKGRRLERSRHVDSGRTALCAASHLLRSCFSRKARVASDYAAVSSRQASRASILAV